MEDKAEQSLEIREKIETLEDQLTHNNQLVSQQNEQLQGDNARLKDELVAMEERALRGEKESNSLREANSKFKEQLWSISEKATAARAELEQLQGQLGESRREGVEYRDRWEEQLGE